MPIVHPSKRAEALASAIRNDPIAAGQIKEFLSTDEIHNCLGLFVKEDFEDKDAEIRRLESELSYYED